MQQAILNTLKYFDVFDYPLTQDELWHWLFVRGEQQVDLAKFSQLLADLENQGKLQRKNGYLFLPNRQKLVEVRHTREGVSYKKMRRAKIMGRILSLMPGVRMILVVSNLGYLNAEKEADIDYLIAVEPGKIWTARFWAVVSMKLLRQRPRAGKSKNKVCLSYFVNTYSLNLETTKIDEVDLHLFYLVSQVQLVYDEDNYWQKYCKANQFITKYLVNFNFAEKQKKHQISNRWDWIKKIFELSILPFEEMLYKKIQLQMMDKRLKQAKNRGDNKVIVNDQMLKLHLNDKREEINKQILN